MAIDPPVPSSLCYLRFADFRLPSSVDELASWYNYAMTELPDKRTEGWFTMGTPHLNLIFFAAYLLFVAVGRRVMKGRTGPELRAPLFLYSFGLAIFNLWLLVGIWRESVKLNMPWYCNAVNYSEDSSLLLWYIYLYYMSKLVEFGDTIFFIVRGKLNQVTFLHVFHHSFMWVSWYAVTKYAGGGEAYFGAGINSFIHVIMYTYYALAALKVRVPEPIKKMVTKLQLVQFVIVAIHCSFGLRDGCGYPNWLYELFFYIVVAFFILFANFYIRSYIFKGNKRKRN